MAESFSDKLKKNTSLRRKANIVFSTQNKGNKPGNSTYICTFNPFYLLWKN